MRSEFALIAIALLFAASTPATASVNMRITDRESSKVTFNLSKGSMADDVDTITTTSTESYFKTRGLIRDLADDEVYLTFEYTSTADVQGLELTFTPPQKKEVPLIQLVMASL